MTINKALLPLSLSLVYHLFVGLVIDFFLKMDDTSFDVDIGFSHLSPSKNMSLSFGPPRLTEILSQNRPVVGLPDLQIQKKNTTQQGRTQRLGKKSTTISINNREEALKRIQLLGENIQSLNGLDFDLQFLAPEDFLQDEHNSPGKKFYSFFWRSYLTYVSRIISTYQDMQLTRPLVEEALLTEKHLMTAKVIFNRQGEIISLQILKTSSNNHVQDFFKKSLEKIQIPNPPSELLDKNGTFMFHYVLRIN